MKEEKIVMKFEMDDNGNAISVRVFHGRHQTQHIKNNIKVNQIYKCFGKKDEK